MKMAGKMCVNVFRIVLLVSVCTWGAHTVAAASDPTLVQFWSNSRLSEELNNNPGDYYLVEFYTPRCKFCKNFASDYAKFSIAMRNVIKCIAIDDVDANATYNILYYPTINFIVSNGPNADPTVVTYEGDRSLSSLSEFVSTNITNLIQTRMTGKSSSSEGSKQSGNRERTVDVIALTDANFQEKVMNDDENIWFIKFYAPWCGHCKKMAPDWVTFAKENIHGKLKIGEVDCDQNSMTAKRFGIKGFPTLKLLPAGKKSESLAQDYELPRDLSNFKAFVAPYITSTVKAEQLIGEAQFREKCQTGVCIMAFLPHILDSGTAKRTEYINTLNEVVKASVSMPLHFFWTQGGDFLQFENSLNLAFGYPAIIAVHLEKEKFGVHRGSFTRESIESLLNSLKVSGVPLQNLPKLKPLPNVQPWDGKDGVLPQDDDDL